MFRAPFIAATLLVASACADPEQGGKVGSSDSGGAPATGGAPSINAGNGSGGAPGGYGSGGSLAATGGTSAGRGSAGRSGTTGGGGSDAVGGVGGTSSAGGSSMGGSGAAGGRGDTAGQGGALNTGGFSGQAGASGGTSDAVDATALAKAMGFGANIGNTLENTTSWETGWGQPLITEAFINGMASRGIKTVRVPVAWDTYAAGGVIDASKFERVKQVVGWIEAAGMYSIVNIHWDGGWLFNEGKPEAYRLTDDVKAKFTNYWQQIASGFSDVGHSLILEALNEEGRFYVDGDPNGTPDLAPLNTLNQLFVTTVRGQGGYNATRALLIAGFNTDINKTTVDAFAVPTDPAGPGKLFLSIHYYDPYTFTLMEDAESWGAPSATWGTDAEQQALEAQFDKLGSFSTNRGLPVIIGEFTVTRGEKVPRESASRLLWLKSVATAAVSRGMVPVLWDTGTDVNRTDGSISSELQAVLNDLD